MIKEYIATGKTIEEAVANAKAGLNAPAKYMLEIKTEVMEMPRKKILGLFGGADAKVKAYYDDGVSEKKQQKKQKPAKKAPQKKDAPKKNQPKKEPVKKLEPKKETAKQEAPKAEAVKRDYPETVDLEYAKAYLAEILRGLNVDGASIDASYKEGVITIDLTCEDYGIIIGRRGETLDAIQYLISLAVKKNANTYIRVSINVGNYREKRNETLKHLAKKNSAYVLRTKRRYTFEPMNPYERRVIHTAVQEIEGVESRSIGSNQERRVVIEPVGGAVKAPRRDDRRAKPVTAAPADHAPKADRADLPKFGKIEVNKD